MFSGERSADGAEHFLFKSESLPVLDKADLNHQSQPPLPEVGPDQKSTVGLRGVWVKGGDR